MAAHHIKRSLPLRTWRMILKGLADQAGINYEIPATSPTVSRTEFARAFDRLRKSIESPGCRLRDRTAAIAILNKKGWTVTALAWHFHCSRGAIAYHLKKHAIEEERKHDR